MDIETLMARDEGDVGAVTAILGANRYPHDYSMLLVVAIRLAREPDCSDSLISALDELAESVPDA